MLQSLMNKFLNKETISYLFWGVVTTVVNIVSYRICTFLGIHYLVANVVAWVLAVAIAFVTNKLFVFQSKSLKPEIVLKEATGFVAARLFSGACDMGFMAVSVSVFGMNDMLAKIITNVFVIVVNYVLSKLFIFKKKETTSNEEDHS